MKRLRRFAPLLLVGIGCLKFLGYFTGWATLIRLGAQSVAAPLPIVFSARRDAGSVSARFVLRVETALGETIEIHGGPGFHARIRGPFQRAQIYTADMMQAHPVYLERYRARDTIVGFGICDRGPLARDLGIDDSVARFTVTKWFAGAAEDEKMHVPFDCTR